MNIQSYVGIILIGLNVPWYSKVDIGDLQNNLFRDIFIAGFAEEGKCQQEHICSSVAQRPKPVIILLSWIHEATINYNMK